MTLRLQGVVIETEQLRLRRGTVDDLDEHVGIHADPEITRFMGPFDRAKATDWLHQVDATWQEHGYGRVAITDRATGRLLGRTGLMYLPQFGETELGWTLRREVWGCGYATEAVKLPSVSVNPRVTARARRQPRHDSVLSPPDQPAPRPTRRHRDRRIRGRRATGAGSRIYLRRTLGHGARWHGGAMALSGRRCRGVDPDRGCLI